MRPQSKQHSDSWLKRTLLLSARRLRIIVAVAVLVAIAGLQPEPQRQIQAQSCANPIACENTQAGNPASEWDISGAGDSSIQGFATDISVNKGETVHFKIDTDARAYQLNIYRMGYYGGAGARNIATVTPSAPLPQTQPACLTDAATGLIDCGNWAESASWSVPATAVSGIYFAKLVRTDNGRASHIVFVVRDDTGASELLFQTSDTTWQAYNTYGGNSLYVGGPGAAPNRAYKVSYNRPITTRGTSSHDFVFQNEYPMVRWLEANGYNVSYYTGIDSDRRGGNTLQQGGGILSHKVFLSVGHDEYWSGAQRTNVEAARNAGVHLAFFSGNEVFWKTRWENSIDGSNTANRTLVCYKETHFNARLDPLDPTVWTGTWRDPRFSPPADGGRPENALTGTLFRMNDSGTSFAITVPEPYGKMRFWRNTSVATLAPGTFATLTNNTLGYEWDESPGNGFQPAGLAPLSSTTITTSGSFLLDYGSTYGAGTATHSLSLYRHSSGALVFGAGTIQWSWGLDGNHDGASSTPDPNMRQATVNLLADMGSQPATLQAGLVSATASTDTTAPTSTITSPTNGATVNVGSSVTITGTATDTGGVVAGVEVSTDGGTTWNLATGLGNWSYAWTPSTTGSATLRSRAVDDSGNLGTPSPGITVTVSSTGSFNCPCSLWNNATTPAVTADPDSSAVELGVKFRSSVSGFITGVRFYKGSTNTGTHVGSLWSSSGALLSTVTFTNETASGWQQATFPSAVAISANTTYVVSYHTTTGHYALNEPGFGSSFSNAPLTALQDGVDGGNGVYLYGAGGFPIQTFNSSNYWVDVVFNTVVGPDTTPPSVSNVVPSSGATNVDVGTAATVTFSEAMKATTISSSTFELRGPSNTLIPATVTYNTTTLQATLTPTAALAPATTYTARVKGGSGGVTDVAGNAMTSDFVWSFTTGVPLYQGSGGPVLIISSSSDPFTRYYAEILRAEGFNSFTTTDLSSVSATTLASYDVVILGSMPLTASQVTMFTNWVNTGGNLIAMRPDKQLAPLLGLTDAAATLSNAYQLVNTTTGPGVGIVNQTIQFKGAADRYTLNGATSVATLYSNATTATTNPAVTLRSVGSNGGQAAAFTYDLARSIVYLRQGDPAWSGQERDGLLPIRSDDLYFGNASGNPQTDWVDLNKVAIPQADEAQRLLANLILQMNLDKKPLPRFWYFPRGLKAVVIMTGDDHANGGTAGRFDQYIANSPSNCSVANWECIRGTSYIYPNTPLTDAQAAAYNAAGFEVALHVLTGCADWDPASLESFYSDQLTTWAAEWPSLPPPVTNRTHCIAWSDYATQPQVELKHGIRLDTDYYYWPGSWITDRPGFFTGSGMPMRFAALDGTMIDVYQATTQITDESGQTIPSHINTLLDNALGPQGYYGAITANMHTDFNPSDGSVGSDAIVASSKSRGVPVVTSRQMLTWLDGRNSSAFGSLNWNTNTLSFTIAVGGGANNLQAMAPMLSASGTLTGITRNGTPVSYTTQTIKGIDYAFFSAVAGPYQVTYGVDTTPPTVTGVTPANNATGVTINTTVTATFSEAMDSTTINANTVQLNVGGNTQVAATVSYDVNTHAATLTPNAALAFGTAYTATVVGGSSGVKDLVGNALATNFTWSFTTTPPPSCPCSLWTNATVPTNPTSGDTSAVELGVKFSSEVAGYITDIRFYKGTGNTGTHVGHLWTSNGTLLATVTFANETATGWQQATLSTPVAVAANTTYVVSYYAPAGNYASNSAYFNNEYVNVPLHGLVSGASGGNGVYLYGSGGVFPTNTFNATNYWVDVVFNTNVVADTTPPTVTGVSPTNGATNVAPTTTVTVTFSEAMAASTITTSTVQLLNAAQAVVPATVNASGATATLTPNSALTDLTTYTVKVVGGSGGVTDVAGNALAATFTSTFTVDAPPTVSSVSPASGATNVAVSTAVTVTFSKAMNAATITTSTVQLRNASNTLVAASVSYNTSTNVATLTPSSALANNTTYTATVVGGANGVKDLAGNALAASFKWSFMTPDTTPPTVTGVTPTNGATGISRGTNVTVTFSEAMTAATINTTTFQLRNAANTLITAAVSYNATARRATLNPSSNLAATTTYTATVGGGSSGVKDSAGNALANELHLVI